ncbi:hypothetical protein D3C76_1429900 [compost metagenome]
MARSETYIVHTGNCESDEQGGAELPAPAEELLLPETPEQKNTDVRCQQGDQNRDALGKRLKMNGAVHLHRGDSYIVHN